MKNPFLKNEKREESGFTLVETLVAIAVLMIAIAGPLTVAEKGLTAAIYAKNQLMASYLAQDALESIKNAVDTNKLNSTAWLTVDNRDLTSYCPSSTNQCIIDTIANAISNCGSCISNPLNLNPNGYSYSGMNKSAFTRTFYVTPFSISGGTNNAAYVTVSVTWPGAVGGGGGVTLEDTLYSN